MLGWHTKLYRNVYPHFRYCPAGYRDVFQAIRYGSEGYKPIKYLFNAPVSTRISRGTSYKTQPSYFSQKQQVKNNCNIRKNETKREDPHSASARRNRSIMGKQYALSKLDRVSAYPLRIRLEKNGILRLYRRSTRAIHCRARVKKKRGECTAYLYKKHIYSRSTICNYFDWVVRWLGGVLGKIFLLIFIPTCLRVGWVVAGVGWGWITIFREGRQYSSFHHDSQDVYELFLICLFFTCENA